MKKQIFILLFAFCTVIAGFATDMTTVWHQIESSPKFISGQTDTEKATKNGFQQLNIAINSAPTSEDIQDARRLIATIDSNQKVTTISQQGVDVSVFAAPAAADMSLLKLMLVIDKNDNADKALIVMYGVTTPDGLTKALQNLSIEDLIGG